MGVDIQHVVRDCRENRFAWAYIVALREIVARSSFHCWIVMVGRLPGLASSASRTCTLSVIVIAILLIRLIA